MLLTDLICAQVDRAQEIVRDHPNICNWPALEMKGIDNAALAALALVWSDKQLSCELETGEVLASRGQDGPWVLAVPNRLRDLITSMRTEEIPNVAANWVTQGDMKFVSWAA